VTRNASRSMMGTCPAETVVGARMPPSYDDDNFAVKGYRGRRPAARGLHQLS